MTPVDASYPMGQRPLDSGYSLPGQPEVAAPYRSSQHEQFNAQPTMPPYSIQAQNPGYSNSTQAVHYNHQSPGQTTVTVYHPSPTGRQPFAEAPVSLNCPQCTAKVTTSTHYEAGSLTWIIAGVLCLIGCWLGCCLIPCCCSSCKDVVHTCPNCRQTIGRMNRM